ncbi:hypothetical protein Rhopal_001081-T1 [Rhodotorula paludigena]|uniref:Uncharacterized protein n=1 Tax=Rhodotorula paludigena TaxID=86838 RepID=A0AAV5GEQ5_9BASI|nr:hypothetical protein Rhopal_001081-T1 [Rhodotorula paludigena]
MLASTALFCLLSLRLVSALPLPQGSFPAVQTPDANSSATTSTASAPVNPAAPAPDVQESTSSSSSTTNPADLSGLLSSLGDLQALGGTNEGSASSDPATQPSRDFATFDADRPKSGEAGDVGDLLAGAQNGQLQRGRVNGSALSSTPNGSVAPTSASKDLPATTADSSASAPTAETFDIGDFLADASFPAELSIPTPTAAAAQTGAPSA